MWLKGQQCAASKIQWQTPPSNAAPASPVAAGAADTHLWRQTIVMLPIVASKTGAAAEQLRTFFSWQLPLGFALGVAAADDDNQVNLLCVMEVKAKSRGHRGRHAKNR